MRGSVERQPDAEQPQRQPDLAAQVGEVDPRRVAEEHERQGRLGQRADRRAAALEVDLVEHRGPRDEPGGDEDHRGGDGRPEQPPRHRGDPEQHERHDREGPRHAATVDGAVAAAHGS
jgi:hypothetical protein